MPRRRGRRLNPLSGHGDGDCYADGDCPLSPPPPIYHFAPGSAPAPAPSPSVGSSPDPCPPYPAMSPAPVPTASWPGRRDQGPGRGYGSPPGNGGGGGDHNRRLLMSALTAAAVIAFVSLILLGVSVAVRRRQVRRRRQALLAAPAAAPAAPADDDPEGGGGGGGGVVHHVWYIRTVGLDEAAIGSIAATRYRAGAGLLGAADCTVCLGEFQDGELVRLLPKCGHAFHVPCIDTWLRAHVNCPLCRSDVLHPAVTTDAGGGEPSFTPEADPVSDNNAAAAVQAGATLTDEVAEHEQEEGDHRGASASSEEDHQHVQPNHPETPPQLPCPLSQNLRRAASMDATIASTAADVAAALERLPEAAPPEEEQNGRRKRGGTGPFCVKASGSDLRRNLSTDRLASVGIPRSFFSRHSRARSSVLPLRSCDGC